MGTNGEMGGPTRRDEESPAAGKGAEEELARGGVWGDCSRSEVPAEQEGLDSGSGGERVRKGRGFDDSVGSRR